MERRIFGRTGMEVSALGFGGAWIGDESVAPGVVTDLLDAAIGAGLNVVDTAPVYGDSEEKLGVALEGRRDEVLLFGKCGEAAGLPGEDWEPDVIRRSVDRSLQRLRTDRLDLLTIHSCELDVLQRGDVIEAVQRAKAAGKTRFIAYSGDNEALAYAVETGAFDAIMTSVNVADQANLGTVARAHGAGLGVIAKRPIANAAWMRVPDADDYGRTYWERLQELKYEGLDLRLALGWTLAQQVHTAIVGTMKPEEWAQDAELLNGRPPSPEAIAAIHARWGEIADESWIGLT